MTPYQAHILKADHCTYMVAYKKIPNKEQKKGDLTQF